MLLLAGTRNKVRRPFALVLSIAALVTSSLSFAGELHVAVAANFRATAEELADTFTEQKGHQVSISSASSGALYNQILYGAPYDLFLSADTERPKLLEDKSLIVSGSRYLYAYGRLVLWQRDGFIKDFDVLHTVKGKIAMPDAELAPYGAAAKQAMEFTGHWKDIQSRLVRGSSVQQSWQFIASGNARIGFVAWSQLVGQVKPESVYFIPESYHAPLRQELVILERSEKQKLAAEFSLFVRSPEGQDIIEALGYKPVLSVSG